MRKILISIQPKWVQKILSGEKTIEVRKTMPKCQLPAEVYIYCTKPKKKLLDIMHKGGEMWGSGAIAEKTEIVSYRPPVYGVHGSADIAGKVVAKFTLNKISPAIIEGVCADRIEQLATEACLTIVELINYGNGKDVYAWRISDLQILDKPMDLGEFYTLPSRSDCCIDCLHSELPIDEEPCKSCTAELKYLTRPPQSWQYVEVDK